MPITDTPLTVFDSIESTNNYAMGQAHSGSAVDGEAWMALEQTKGKGRRSKNWHSEKGLNIMLSISIETGFLPLFRQFELSVCTALGCADFFSKYAGNEVKIKWPNDIYYHDNKAGGILIENVIKGKLWQWSIIGIGININQTVFSKEMGNPTSLKLITGKEYDIISLAKDLRSAILKRIDSLKQPDVDLLEEYNLLLFKKGAVVKLKKQNMVFETTIVGVNAHGELMTRDTLERVFSFDEIDWIL